MALQNQNKIKSFFLFFSEHDPKESETETLTQGTDGSCGCPCRCVRGRDQRDLEEERAGEVGETDLESFRPEQDSGMVGYRRTKQ
jgi:hypothetical protein